MRLKSDFPALSDSVAAINRLASSEEESVTKLAEVVLKDYALTNKLLRLANAAHYHQFGGGRICTVSRAIIVLGFDAVRNLALTVLLFEHLENQNDVQALKESFLRASMAGLIARASCQHPLLRQRGEEAYICALFHDLGRLLAQYYFPEEYAEIEKRRMGQNMNLEAAALQVLGISFEDLGLGIARHWGLPENLIHGMRRLPSGGHLEAPTTTAEALRLVSGYANELCDALAAEPSRQWESVLDKIADRFSAALAIDRRRIEGHLEKAFSALCEFASLLHIDLAHSPFARQIARCAGATSFDEAKEEGHAGLPPSAYLDLVGEAADEEGVPSAEDILAAGIRDISAILLETGASADALRIMLESIYRALACRRVVLAMRDGKGTQMLGRFGLGPEAEGFVRRFRFPLGAPASDVFQLALARGVDILISDVEDAHIADKIPPWWRGITSAKTFLLLPLVLSGRAVALVYAEKEKAHSLVLSERLHGLVKALRNQALLALKSLRA
ncbi:MAG: HDOD domain-containing protein [Rhodocyclaceae bacterium]|nr:HDOD domain-containing protein [Rhodocyclaceae bacterium]